jgi:DNA-binding MarR family transcriptional regulator
METIELKFLLKLLAFANYQAPLSRITPNSKTSAVERERICRKLRDRELVDYSCEITKFRIAPLGKALLKSDTDEPSVTSQELKILKACEKSTITPRKTGIPEAEQQTVLQSLEDRGLIQVSKKDKKIKEVWLTERGKDCLREEYDPKGAGNLTITKNMLADYLRFLRHSISYSELQDGLASTLSLQQPIDKPSDKEILKIINNLDRKMGKRRGLPIFYLREKLQPPLSREELDRTLFRLEKDGAIELRVIEEAWRYTDEEFFAGIPQRLGSRLFFIWLK